MKKINKKNKIVKNLKLKENLDRFVTYYTGETINGLPHGKGTSETYESVKGIDEKVHKKVGKKWVDNYQKFFLKKLKYHNIEKKYVGEWKNGMWNGKGELTEYDSPAYSINDDGGPKIYSISIGCFVDGKKNGEFEEYLEFDDADHKGETWMKKYYKKGWKVKKRINNIKSIK